ncbi:MAG: hypothetical protein JNN32_00395 [Flavobacteriales bacterium]|nr:hypothetical protein [Flavobacteriales bacterium]
MIRSLSIFSVLIALAGCRKTESVPAYLEVDAVSVSATDEQGGGSSKITDVWVTVDERSLGVWQLPARIPVLAEGVRSIGITGGIQRNGAFDDRLRYPYYTIWNGSAELKSGATTQVSPVVLYQPSTIWFERFNDAGSQLVANPESDTTLLLISAAERPEAVFDGSQCGGFVLDAVNDRLALQTEEDFPGASGPVYLEMDYSTDIELTIGFTYESQGITEYEPWVVLVPTASVGSIQWNKVYVELSNLFNLPGITGRDIYIGAQLSGGRTSAVGYFDNLKIVRPA